MGLDKENISQNLVGIENEEFDFSKEPALGGPLINEVETEFQVDLIDNIHHIKKQPLIKAVFITVHDKS